MDYHKLVATVGCILLALGISGATAYVAGYFIYVFLNC